VDYAARVASELGADIVKINVPKIDAEKDKMAPKPYSSMSPTREEATRMVVESAGKALVLFSGGEMQGDGDIIDKARTAMDAGATGLIFGRNVWQRPFDEAIALSKQFSELLSQYSA
jgi:class I fructose-bisphosphate aldolase